MRLLVLTVVLAANIAAGPASPQAQPIDPNECFNLDFAASKRLKVCTRTLEQLPLAPQAQAIVLYYRALAFRDLEKHAAAVEDFTASHDLDSSNPQTLYWRGDTRMKLEDFEAAAEDFLAWNDMAEPKEVWDLLPAAIAFREAGNYAAALDQLERAKDFDEDGPGTGPGMAYHFHLGRTFHEMGRYQEAYDTYTNGIPKQEDYFYIYFRRAEALEAMGRQDEADENYRFGLNGFKTNPETLEGIDAESREELETLGARYGIELNFDNAMK